MGKRPTKAANNFLCRARLQAAGIKQVASEPVLPSTCQKCAMVNQYTKTFINCGSCANKDIKYKVTISVPQLSGNDVQNAVNP